MNSFNGGDSSAEDDWTDSEADEESNNDYTAFNARYMDEITNILSFNNQVNCDNALELNKEMQQRLQEVRKRLQSLLHSVQERYLLNEQRLKLNVEKKQKGFGMRGAYLKGGTFFFKGNMFFKDLKCRNCPNNQDYEHRRNIEGEMFPMDFELCSRHVWSLIDKQAVVQAVKEQVIDYLTDRKFRDKNSKIKRVQLDIQVHTEKLANLLTQVDEKFEIDWEQVSAHNLKYRHSPSSCKAMWQVYLHPSLKRSAWTDEENKRLLHIAQKHNYQNWESIAKSVTKRSDYQCFIQYQTSVCFMDTQRWGRWDKRDDKKLLELILKKTINGVIDWNAVASYFPHKPKKSLHQRYIYYLDPKISHEPFTAEEDLILLAAVEEYGEKFALFPRTLFPNRSITQLRMRYKNTLQTRHMLTPWSVEDDKKLMEFISEHGTSAWLRCAESLGNHNRISCRTRFLTIKKFFEKNPEATIDDIPRKKTCIMKNSVITKQNWVDKVAELRENPDTVLVPMNRRFKQNKNKKVKIKKGELLSPEGPPKCTVQSARVIEVKNRKQPYVERLRAVEQKLYHFFKYTYNFKLGTDVCNKAPNQFLRIVSKMLVFKADPTRPYIADNILSHYIGRRCKFHLQHESLTTSDDCSKPFNCTLPPSWSTAMGFRALCVQSAESQIEDLRNDNAEERKPSEFDRSLAVQRFRKRMHTLFYQTALLSRLEPAHFTELTKIPAPPPTFTTVTDLTPEDFFEDTSTSVVENEAEVPIFDLNRVKTEEPSEYAANSESTSKKQCKQGRPTKLNSRKRKMKTLPVATQRAAVKYTGNGVGLEDNATGSTYKSPETQPILHLHNIKQECQAHTALLQQCSLHTPSEEPAEKRVYVDTNCNRSDVSSPTIKTEFEL
ncbi:uncharacterized protein LOC101457522 isoform X2 [Ceratitis capitata]|uniref:uncharacterized protein LOC101457522 isoform X2 n=1 Tax=Ceratitis capitata TaxID=7213 RepID=UPI000329BCA9|nr:uncharacterized protein LOC101457522 isoform X2 [Ceratitis capitata]